MSFQIIRDHLPAGLSILQALLERFARPEIIGADYLLLHFEPLFD